MNPWAGVAMVLGALALLFAGVRALPRGGVDAEGSRKLVHLGMGVVCLTFPWLFVEPWPVWFLATLACLALTGLRVVPFLRRELGTVLHEVERASWGELCFPIGVAAVFTLAGGDPVQFVIPVALLTFADAAGALVGKRWGRRRYQTLEGTKTVEGSAAVGVTGFLCAAVPLLVAGHELSVAVLIGALMGLLGLLVEAISWRGLDNVFVPLAAFVQISVYLGLRETDLLVRLAALVAIAIVALVWRRGHLVDDSARLGGALALYFFWVVGGWAWLVAPLVLLASYVRLMPTVPGGLPRHNMVAVICVGSTALVYCVAHRVAPAAGWLWPFTLGVAAQQAIIATVRFSQGQPRWPRAVWWLIGVSQATGLHLFAFWLLDRGQTVNPAGLAVGAACVAVAVAGFVLWEKRLQLPDDVNARWWKQGTAALAASVAGFVVVNL